jgi:hypothetical protein
MQLFVYVFLGWKFFHKEDGTKRDKLVALFRAQNEIK